MLRRSSLLLAAFAVAYAHPMGNFSVSHYTRLEVSSGGVTINYVLDLAEAPTYELLRDWKLDQNTSQPALDAKALEQARDWTQGLEFRSAGRVVQARALSASVRLTRSSDGQATARIAAALSLPGAKSPLQFEDRNYPDRNGWKEIVVEGGPGVQIVTASQPGAGRSNELMQYPADALAAAPQDLRARVEWRAGGSGKIAARIIPIDQPPAIPPPPQSSAAPVSAPPAKGDFLSRLLARREIGWGWMLLGLAVAFGLGGAHALEPGHGKTLVAAYLVGSRGTMKHAALLGGMVTFTHTISVFILGLAMLALSKSVVPDRVIRILEAVSGVSIVLIGAVMLRQRLRSLRSAAPPQHHHGDHHHHRHDRPHTHDHSHTRDHPHEHEHPHTHEHPHSHPEHAHDHGPHGHSHLPEGEITAGSLIALGVSGGLVPCPAALVLMLAAIAFGHAGAGLVLLIAFSLGLAAVLMAVGMMVLYAKSWLPDLSQSSRGPIFRLVPVFSAIVVVCLGLIMTGVSLGLLRPGLSV